MHKVFNLNLLAATILKPSGSWFQCWWLIAAVMCLDQTPVISKVSQGYIAVMHLAYMLCICGSAMKRFESQQWNQNFEINPVESSVGI